ncbi:CBS domain containing membrane protein [Solidesulfovibrio carbinoliphilus subsp. oakridgensis]|uniref:CBS domain containing membrane protein n=1 Tax=Solidesulfovibrio carbinoliphilus subsp. oakridgensis TaxID=694327 RepID=G7Q8Z2_9BACT|nr:CBS and ACT domain-containing protein [Solidesulfovibrio carbinoliphilus]EHJ47478.1 CBS domain containing membrane protein [Solidesulfovibrio carbinoliphilus subsp. oakridgensis]
MLVGDWMSTDVATVTEDVSMIKAGRIMREKKIRRLPVVDRDGRLVGIVSERDLKAASPSSATTLDMYEMTYLLSELKIKGLMTRNPVSIRRSDTVERAALIMRDRKFGSLPVIDEAGKVVGIITDTDIFRLFVSITGIDQGGIQIGVRLGTNEGSLKPVLDALRHHKARIISILSSYDQADPSLRDVSIRIQGLPELRERELRAVLGDTADILYWTRD